MNSPPETAIIDRYIGIDIHKHYVMVGGQNANQEWILKPRQVQMVHFGPGLKRTSKKETQWL